MSTSQSTTSAARTSSGTHAARPAGGHVDLPQRRDPASRPVGRRGLNPTFARIIIRTVARDRGALFFAVAFPIFFFLMFGANKDSSDKPFGVGTIGGNILVGMALYGVLTATIAAGSAVANERATGWTRQLRLTPLAPTTYVLIRSIAGMILGAVSVVTVFVIGYLTGVRMPAEVWLLSGLVTWAGGALFSALGLALGYLLRSANAMRVVGPLLSVLAFLGGLFIPLDDLGTPFKQIAPWTPLYGVHELALAPFQATDFPWGALVNALAWLALSVGVAARTMSRDTGRV